MNTIEIIVYTGIAIIVVGLGLNFIVSIEGESYYSSFKKILINDNEIQFERTNPYSFIKEIFDVWESCAKGEIELSQTVYVEKDEYIFSIDKEFIFSEIKKINYCSQLQSSEFECGSKEDLEMDSSISLPAVIEIKCSEEGIELIS